MNKMLPSENVGKRKFGGPKMRWECNVKADLRETNSQNC